MQEGLQSKVGVVTTSGIGVLFLNTSRSGVVLFLNTSRSGVMLFLGVVWRAGALFWVVRGIGPPTVLLLLGVGTVQSFSRFRF